MDFLRSWHRWRGQSLVPKRSQIKLHDMPDLMRGMMLLDAHGPDTFIFRYAGSIFQEAYDYDFTGLNYLDITSPGDKSIRARRLWAQASHPVASVWMTPSVRDINFIGVSVPIWPDAPDTYTKIMQVLIPVRDPHHLASERRQRGQGKVERSTSFRYLDIGAGIPEDDLQA
ncbi:PAS domain-containing protein [Kordiimonas sp.]|uniref:PAS domain-containing protein n=1 Tax=Kordiimonas sp. TaxID=1970157 RepID=UPI003A8FDFAB